MFCRSVIRNNLIARSNLLCALDQSFNNRPQCRCRLTEVTHFIIKLLLWNAPFRKGYRVIVLEVGVKVSSSTIGYSTTLNRKALAEKIPVWVTCGPAELNGCSIILHRHRSSVFICNTKHISQKHQLQPEKEEKAIIVLLSSGPTRSWRVRNTTTGLDTTDDSESDAAMGTENAGVRHRAEGWK